MTKTAAKEALTGMGRLKERERLAQPGGPKEPVGAGQEENLLADRKLGTGSGAASSFNGANVTVTCVSSRTSAKSTKAPIR